MKKLEVDNLSIEVTRRCNTSCAHCLRGEPEDLDINIKYITDFFAQIKHVNALTISGGEPSLVPDKILGILEVAKNLNVSINYFYLVTNGLNISKKFLHVMTDLYSYCLYKDRSSLYMSNDQWHPKVPKKNIEKLESLSFFKSTPYFGESEFSKEQWARKVDIYLVNQGRAVALGAKRDIKGALIYLHNDTILSYEDDTLYLNCQGKIVKSGGLSYISQYSKENILCKASDNLRDFITWEFKNGDIQKRELPASV
jgi:organic radical activating enzyme